MKSDHARHPLESTVVLLAVSIGVAGNVHAQRLAVDPTFAPQVLVRSMSDLSLEFAPLPDGRFLLRGGFSYVDSVPAAGVAVLLPDGSRDENFSYDGDPLMPPSRVVRLTDGRLIVARSDDNVATRSHTVRFERHLADGSRDPSFSSFATSEGWVNHLVLQSDGRVIIGGQFAQLGGLARDGLARLAADGTIDAAYAPTLAGPGTALTDLVVGSDGTVTVTAYATDTYDYNHFLRRIRPDGSIEPGFVPAFGVYPVYGGLLAALPDGTMLTNASWSGGFATFRYDATGATTLFAPALPAGFRISAVTALDDGRMLVVAASGDDPAPGKSGIFLLRVDGAVETDYRALFAADEALQLVAVTATGDLIIRHGQWFVPVLPPGVLTFAPFTGVLVDPAFARVDLAATAGSVLPINVGEIGTVFRMHLLASGGMLVSGTFDQIDGVERRGLARLHADGTLDAGFIPSPANSRYAHALIMPDGRLLAYFSSENQPAIDPWRVVRLQDDGTLDSTLPETAELRTRPMRVHAIDPGGRVVASFFEPDNSSEANLRLALFHPDGSRAATLATTFDGLPQIYVVPPGSGPTRYLDGIDEVQVLDGGGFLVSGTFEHANGRTAPGLVRLMSDGQVDPSYQAPIQPGDQFHSAQLLRGGRALVSTIRLVNGAWENRSVRLLPDGSVDPTFAPPHETLLAAAYEQSDGTFIARGDELWRWSATGILDLNVEVPIDGIAHTAETASDGTVYVGGSFRTVQGVASFGLARLRPVEVPGITFQPEPQSAHLHMDAEFQVAIGDLGAATYQWQFNNVDLPDATRSVLVVTDVTTANTGAYRVVITVGPQVYVSDTVMLALKPSTARLANFSARSRVHPAHPPQIAGFFTSSSTPRQVLLRAIGRGLPWNLPGPLLARPSLGLFAGPVEVARNEGGALDAGVQAVAQRVGAFPPRPWNFPGIQPTADSALVTTLTDGVFSALTTTVDETGGVSLFEFYDAAETPTPGFVENVSLRGRTAPGAAMMIGGFVIAGEGPLTLLLRVVGPELAQWTVPDVLADPQLTLYAGAQSIGSNDDWSIQGNPGAITIDVATATTGAFPLEPGSKSAALIATLEPGAYTVHANGAGQTEGEVLLEIYVVDE